MKKVSLSVFAFLTIFLFQGCMMLPCGARYGGGDASVSELIEQVKPALVQIRSTNPEGVFLMALAERMGIKIPKDLRQYIKINSGSGFIVDPSGVVVTNHHVLHPGWLTEVTLADGRKFLVDAMGSIKKNDIGVIVLQGVIEPLPYIKWARKQLEVGDEIFMLGRSPRFDFAYKEGVVSHPGRLQFDGSFELQTPMPVVPGESGSAVFNGRGRIVGVVSSYYFRINGISACVPGPIAENDVKAIVQAIKKEQRKQRK